MVNGWVECPITEVLKTNGIKIGPFGSQLKKEMLLSDGVYRVYGQENVYEHDFNIGDRYLTREHFNRLNSCEILPGDFVMSTMGTIGKCAIVPATIRRGIMDSHLIRLRFDEKKVRSDYILQLFSDQFHYLSDQTARLAVGGIMDGLSVGIVSRLNVIYPESIEEQEKIVEVLSDIDALILRLNKLIAKKKNILRGTMQSLLSGKIRISDSLWEKYVIGDIGDFYSGLTGKSKDDFGKGKARYITFLNVLNNTVIDISKLESVQVNEDEYQNEVLKGDLFFNTSSETPEEVGMCAVLMDSIRNTYLNSFCFGFRLKTKKVHALFFSYYFNSQEGRKIMRVLAQGATRFNLSKDYFSQTVIELPPYEDQVEIAQTLADMEGDILSLEKKCLKYKAIKQGMMEELLTGKVRLI